MARKCWSRTRKESFRPCRIAKNQEQGRVWLDMFMLKIAYGPGSSIERSWISTLGYSGHEVSVADRIPSQLRKITFVFDEVKTASVSNRGKNYFDELSAVVMCMVATPGSLIACLSRVEWEVSTLHNV